MMMVMMMMMMMMINITIGYTCETTGIKRADQRAINVCRISNVTLHVLDMRAI